MNLVITATPPDHYKWIGDKTGVYVSEHFKAIAALDLDDVTSCEICGLLHPKIKGMTGYSDWTPNSVAMHVALDSPIVTRNLLGPAFVYPFMECDRKIAIGIQRSDNHRARAFARHLGFKPVYTIVDGYADGIDLNILQLTRDEWRAQNGRRRH